jgi:hypothetical protein
MPARVVLIGRGYGALERPERATVAPIFRTVYGGRHHFTVWAIGAHAAVLAVCPHH